MQVQSVLEQVTGNGIEIPGTRWSRIRIVLFSFEQQITKEFDKNENKINNRTMNKINERLIMNKHK